MNIYLKEPVASKYIFVNPKTNKVHLLTPLVRGEEISMDSPNGGINILLRDFYSGGCLRELMNYKKALEFDIVLFDAGHEQRKSKEARLAQIEIYIKYWSKFDEESDEKSYFDKIRQVLKWPSNLYRIQLRPRVQEKQSSVNDPVFSVCQKNKADGSPLSPLYNALHNTFATIAAVDPRSRLITAILQVLPEKPSFADIQQALGEHSLKLGIDFTRFLDGMMPFRESPKLDDYFNTLDYVRTLLEEMLPSSPFYSIPATMPADEKTERLSLLTQFFLANLNVYCKARNLSTQNFGMVLDCSSELSSELAEVVFTALANWDDVEQTLCNFCTKNARKFGLLRALDEKDLAAIRDKFERGYRTVTNTASNPYMNDFVILDKTATTHGGAKFITHQGFICLSFAEVFLTFVDLAPPYRKYFSSIRADFDAHINNLSGDIEGLPTRINEEQLELLPTAFIEVDIEGLLTRIREEQLELLPTALQEACRANPNFQVHLRANQFLYNVARGKQEEAEDLLKAIPENTQALLRMLGVFTDYSSRTFKCTAYEYAYWAKDTHMCRLLERHMDEETKAQMLTRIDTLEVSGLPYQQNGVEHRSTHFDLTPLINALKNSVMGSRQFRCNDYDSLFALQTAWVEVAKLQRDVPAHVAQEYCRPDRSFYPLPKFDEPTLPHVLTVRNYWSEGRFNFWFDIGGMGVLRGTDRVIKEHDPVDLSKYTHDFEAIVNLNKVRTADLAVSRKNLTPSAISHGITPSQDDSVLTQALGSNLHQLAAQPVLLVEHLNTILKSQRLAAVNKKDELGKTVLHLAAAHPDSLRAVLTSLSETERLAAVNEKDRLGRTVLHLAAEHPDNLRALFQAFPALAQEDDLSTDLIHCFSSRENLLSLSTEECPIPIISQPILRDWLLGLDRVDLGQKLRALITTSNISEMVTLLAQENVAEFINGQAFFSRTTALHQAVISGSLEMCRLLLGRGAKIDIKDKEGNTPLHLAILHDKTEIIELLKELPSNWDSKNNEGKTIRDLLNERVSTVPRAASI